MKKFLLRLLLAISVPMALLLGLYLVTDPYKTLKPFSLDYFDSTNRDYLSSELFLANYPTYKYDSFVFGSSAACGINTYHWKSYLPDGSSQFMFQSWSETITGIEQKLVYLDNNGISVNNCLLVLDFPSMFVEDQLPTTALAIKDYHFSGMPFWKYEAILFYNFIQKPSQWTGAISRFLSNDKPYIQFDTVTNDWSMDNHNPESYLVQPKQDSLCNNSEVSRKAFFKEIEGRKGSEISVAQPILDEKFIECLWNIKSIFDKYNSNYEIIIAPYICYTSDAINPSDLYILQEIFGSGKVHNYSGKNSITEDYNNFSDTNHFGLCAGWMMIEEVFNKE